ncbi:MAG: helix-turn-helix domain-containing protein [Elusimicrobiota bacterium]
MIKNDRQCEYTKKKLQELEEDLKALRKKYALNQNKVALLGQGYIEHIAQLNGEIEEYRKMKKEPLPQVLRIHNTDEISHQLVRLRIARKLTQAQLASRIGCKQADVSRLEQKDYQGYTFSMLKKIAAGLGAKIELDLIPLHK